MLQHREHRRFSIQEYLSLEENAACKSEYCDGEIFSMSGASLEHNRLVRNLILELGNTLRGGPCEVFPSDLRLYLDRHRLFTYPDLLIVCGPPLLMPGRRDTLIDATLIIEVLSPSTSDYDRNEKFRCYRSLPSFAEYLLVAQEEVRIEQHRRVRPGEWLMTEHTSLEGEFSLDSVDITLPVQAVYQGVF